MKAPNLVKMYNQYVKDENKDFPVYPFNPDPDKFKITPSSLGSACERQKFYNATRTPRDYGMDLKGKRICHLGDLLEDEVVTALRKPAGLIDYYDKDGNTPIWWKGAAPNPQFPTPAENLFIKLAFIDLVIRADDGGLWLGDCKSIGENGYNSLPKGGKRAHYIQGLMYLHIFNKLLREGFYSHITELKGYTKAEGFILFYYNKNNSQPKQIVFHENENDFGYLIQNILDLKAHADNETLPAKTKEFCNSCAFRDKCAKNHNPYVEYAKICQSS